MALITLNMKRFPHGNDSYSFVRTLKTYKVNSSRFSSLALTSSGQIGFEHLSHRGPYVLKIEQSFISSFHNDNNLHMIIM